ncbi:hypothetical protein DUF177 [Thermacetogenium phaeum DSM 12270]|uniref:DUF177 domain-containing protein n=2 Tax=Thermacetogenium phaeum TaxID=85874 RepID=K4LEE9_THEPS|nr:hypothetical protein DUF177 [Thermacetogenium phaeum DSM 12270]
MTGRRLLGIIWSVIRGEFLVKIDVGELRKKKGRMMDFSGRIPCLTLDLQQTGITYRDLEISGQATNTGEGIFVEGIIRGQTDLNCSLCLKAFSATIEVPFSESYYREEDSVSRLVEEEGRFYQEDEIILDDLIREGLYLALPMKPVCKPDCKGLCPVCGNDMNVQQCRCRKEEFDPRLTALSALLKE